MSIRSMKASQFSLLFYENIISFWSVVNTCSLIWVVLMDHFSRNSTHYCRALDIYIKDVGQNSIVLYKKL